jgi:hypothetical protein
MQSYERHFKCVVLFGYTSARWLDTQYVGKTHLDHNKRVYLIVMKENTPQISATLSDKILRIISN